MKFLAVAIGYLLYADCALAFLPNAASRCNIGSQLEMSVPNAFDTLTSGFASICRLPNGVSVVANLKPDTKVSLLKLYDVENSRPCRSVRERITELDLVVDKVIPATENSRAVLDKTFRDALPESAGVPCLVASVSGGEVSTISGETEILKFLDEAYFGVGLLGTDDSTPSLSEEALDLVRNAGSYVGGALRAGRGSRVSLAATASSRVNRPPKQLILYSYDGNQFCRLVREVFTELDIVYELRSSGKGSPRRAELAGLTGGSTQCPYLVDPNTGTSMSESADIVAYLYKTYALWTPPSEILEWISDFVMSKLKPIFSALVPLQAGSSGMEDAAYKTSIDLALSEIREEVNAAPVVVYTYALSPFSSEAKALLDRLEVEYEEISLGQEWIPGLLAPNGAQKRAALAQMTGQSSLPHIFVGGKPIGGLFSGTPGLLPALKEDTFLDTVNMALTDRKADSPL